MNCIQISEKVFVFYLAFQVKVILRYVAKEKMSNLSKNSPLFTPLKPIADRCSQAADKKQEP